MYPNVIAHTRGSEYGDMESRKAFRIRALSLICLLFLVSLDLVIDQKLCLKGNEVWKMVEVEDDRDWGVDNKRIVDSEGSFSESGGA